MDDDVILIASDGIIIRMQVSEIRLCRRPSKGVRVMRVEEGSRIVSLARAPHEEPEEEAPEEEDIVQHVSPLTDMDSLDFYLWVEEGAQAEADRRQNKPSKPPKAE